VDNEVLLHQLLAAELLSKPSEEERHREFGYSSAAPRQMISPMDYETSARSSQYINEPIRDAPFIEHRGYEKPARIVPNQNPMSQNLPIDPLILFEAMVKAFNSLLPRGLPPTPRRHPSELEERIWRFVDLQFYESRYYQEDTHLRMNSDDRVRWLKEEFKFWLFNLYQPVLSLKNWSEVENFMAQNVWFIHVHNLDLSIFEYLDTKWIDLLADKGVFHKRFYPQLRKCSS